MRKILSLLFILFCVAASAQQKWPVGYDLNSFKGTISIGKPAWPNYASSDAYLEIGDPATLAYHKFYKTGKLQFKYYPNDVGETYFLQTDVNGDVKLAQLAWSKITGTPTTLSGYGITDPIVLTSGSYANPAWITALAWSKITGTPTTVSGYGITDALTGSGVVDRVASWNGTGTLSSSSNFTHNGTVVNIATTVTPPNANWKLQVGGFMDLTGTNARIFTRTYGTLNSAMLCGVDGSAIYYAYDYGAKDVHFMSVGSGAFRIKTTGTTYYENGKVVIGGTTSSSASALAEVNSTTQGFLPPRMTATQAEAISSPAEGLMIYATNGTGVTITSKGWWGYDGSTWVKLN
jgi:hypothetical protein